MSASEMKPLQSRGLKVSLCGAVTAAALLLAYVPNGFAQSSDEQASDEQSSGMFGMEQSDTISLRATVKSVDLKKHTIVLVGDSGETKKLKLGPDVQNLAQVKPGDVVVAQYYESVAYVVAAAGTKTPEDMLALAAAQSEPGEKPAGGVASKVVVTGLVVGVNPMTSTLSLVNPEGGEVHTFVVMDPDYQEMLPDVKVGDTLTAVISDAMAVAVEPAK